MEEAWKKHRRSIEEAYQKHTRSIKLVLLLCFSIASGLVLGQRRTSGFPDCLGKDVSGKNWPNRPKTEPIRESRINKMNWVGQVGVFSTEHAQLS